MNPSNSNFNVGGTLFGAGLGSLLGGAMGPDPNQYYNQIPGVYHQQLDPYSNMGHQLLPQMQQNYQNMMNPGQFLNSMGQGFQQDPGYQFNLHQALMGSNQAQAAGGMAGSPQSQQFGAQIASNMADQGYQNYLNHATGAYNSGLQGMQGLETQGFDASNNMASGLASVLQNQAMMQAAKNQQNQSGMSSMFGGLFGGGGTGSGGGSFLSGLGSIGSDILGWL